MKILLRIVAVLFVIVAAVLVYAVIAAVSSDGGAKPAVAIAYVVGAIVLAVAAARLWRGPANTAPGV
jgi:hypothetical protein